MGLFESIGSAIRDVARDLGVGEDEEGPANASRPDPSLDIAISIPNPDQPLVRSDDTINVACLGDHAGQRYCGPQAPSIATYVGVMAGMNSRPADIVGGFVRGEDISLETVRATAARNRAGVDFSGGRPATLSVRGGYETNARLHPVETGASIDDIRHAVPANRVFLGVVSDSHGQNYAVTMSAPEFSEQRTHIIAPGGIDHVTVNGETLRISTLSVHTGTVGNPLEVTGMTYDGNTGALNIRTEAVRPRS